MTQQGIDLIKSFEGLRLKAYKPVPTEEYYTIGYGHYGPDVTAGMEITKEEAEKLFKNDIEKFEKKVVRPLLPPSLPQLAVDALVSLCYNIGSGNFSKSTLLKAVKTDHKNLQEIEKQFNRWIYSGKTVLNGLKRRREAEYKMYEEGILSAKNDIN